MRRARILVPVVAALCALATSATTATAASEPTAIPEVGLATPTEEAALQQQLAETKPVIATRQEDQPGRRLARGAGLL